MYSVLEWIPRGRSLLRPVRSIPTEAELREARKKAKAQPKNSGENEETNMDGSDTEDGTSIDFIGGKLPDYVLDPSIDPNISVKEDEFEEDFEEDMILQPDDCMMVVGHSDEDQSTLEFHIYNEDDGSFFLHHDIILPAYPLSVAWLDCAPLPVDSSIGGHPSGSYVAVGTFHPEIEIWSTDVLDAVSPDAVLGGRSGGKQRSLKAGSHRKPVMCLSWNQVYRNVLASGSADATVKLWDVTTQKCMTTLSHHSMEVNCIRFHSHESNVLLTTSFDKSCTIVDCRLPTNGSRVQIAEKPETANWDIHSPFCFTVSNEKGSVEYRDMRMDGQSIWSHPCHSDACTNVFFNQALPGLLITSGEDGFVRVWKSENASVPTLVSEKHMKVGNIFGCSCFTSAPYLLAACGSTSDLAVWDLREIGSLAPLFENQVAPSTDMNDQFRFKASGNATGSIGDRK